MISTPLCWNCAGPATIVRDGRALADFCVECAAECVRVGEKLVREELGFEETRALYPLPKGVSIAYPLIDRRRAQLDGWQVGAGWFPTLTRTHRFDGCVSDDECVRKVYALKMARHSMARNELMRCPM